EVVAWPAVETVLPRSTKDRVISRPSISEYAEFSALGVARREVVVAVEQIHAHLIDGRHAEFAVGSAVQYHRDVKHRDEIAVWPDLEYLLDRHGDDVVSRRSGDGQ